MAIKPTQTQKEKPVLKSWHSVVVLWLVNTQFMANSARVGQNVTKMGRYNLCPSFRAAKPLEFLYKTEVNSMQNTGTRRFFLGKAKVNPVSDTWLEFIDTSWCCAAGMAQLPPCKAMRRFSWPYNAEDTVISVPKNPILFSLGRWFFFLYFKFC